MPASAEQHGPRVRSAELVGALCLATDLGMGFPFEHGLRTTLIATRIAERLDLAPAVASQTYFASLLCHAGCTADAHVTAEVFGGSLTTRFYPVLYGSGRESLLGLLRALPDPDRAAPVRALQLASRLPRFSREQRPHLSAMCEVAEMLAGDLGLPPAVAGLLPHLTERWDGRGPMHRAKGEEIPLPMRIVHVAVDAALQRSLSGVERAAQLTGERAGHAFDPEVAGCLAANAQEIFSFGDRGSVWDEMLASEPAPLKMLDGAELDRALGAMGNFADLVSPYLSGHSAGVAELGEAAARRCGMDEWGIAAVRGAAQVHDLGRVAVGAGVWQKPEPLTADEWEAVRLHPYHTERVLSRSSFLRELAPLAGAHHERLDGSGYHRGAAGAELPPPARLLAASDAYHAMIEPRPHRDALTPEQAVEELVTDVSAGRLDPDAVTAVVEAAGERLPRLQRPSGLTAREAEVVGMLARGLQTKQVARRLAISPKTADRHIQNAYAKMGVSTRAGATLFAMENGLVSLRELGPSESPH